MPLACRSVALIKLLAGKLGTLVAYETSTNMNCSEYVRFKVKIDISKPLIRGLQVKLRDEYMWVPFSYESLPYFCFVPPLTEMMILKCNMAQL